MSGALSESFRQEGELRVEERLQLQDLHELMFWFKKHKPPADDEGDNDDKTSPLGQRKKKREAGLLTLEEFKSTLTKVLGSHEYDNQLDTLFTKLDTSCDGYVDWNEFCTYMLLQFKENDFMREVHLAAFQTDPKIRHIVHNRQETTSKVISTENPSKYVVISKEGTMSIFDHNLHYERHCSMTEREDAGSSSQKKKIHYWVTDAVYMANCRKIAVSSTGRDIRFFDITSNTFLEEFYLYSIPVIPNCMDYWFDPRSPGDESLLLYGDDVGGLTIMSFKKPMHQLFSTPFNSEDDVQKVFYPDLLQHAQFVSCVYIPDVHSEAVWRILYLPDNHCTLSACASPRDSLVTYDHDRKKKAYTWRLARGVECFDYKKTLNVLVTGSTDHIVRLWNPYVTSKPTAVLEGHYMAVIDVRIYEPLAVVFSFSRDMALKVWDIKEQYCLQTVHVRFPCSLLGRMPDYGPHPMYLQLTPVRRVLLLAGDYIAQLKLGNVTVSVADQELTHPVQLCTALYNPLFKAVVTGADDSSVIVWDLETGAKSLFFSSMHGTEEITCMTFDQSWRRLFTGAGDGSIKVWNVQNGHSLHEYEVMEEAEVTGILPLADKRQVLVVGWNRKLLRFDDTEHDTHFVKADTSWKGGHVHRDDILTIAHLPPNIVATGSFDGEINVWNLETESLFIRLRKGNPIALDQAAYAELLRMLLRPLTGRGSRPTSRASNNLTNQQQASETLGVPESSGILRPTSRPRSSRPNSRHRSSHRIGKGQQAPIEKLLFLRARAKMKKRNEAGLLISSEAGSMLFWSIYGEHHLQASFYAATRPDESVLSMATSSGDDLLITGDTSGHVSVWNISQYATEHLEEAISTPPPLLHMWEAHDGTAIVNVEHVTHDVGQFVVTASVDCTARLFTIDGVAVGIFGQKKLWNIRIPSSWTGTIDETSEFGELSVRTESPAEEKTEHQEVKIAEEETPPQLDTDSIIHETVDDPEKLQKEFTLAFIPTIEKGDTLVSDEPMPDNTKLPSTPNSVSDIPLLPKIKSHTVTGVTTRHRAAKKLSYGALAAKTLSFYIAHPLASGYRQPGVSDTVVLPNGVKRNILDAHKSFLGMSVEDRFQRITQNRQGRREFKDGLSLPEVNRMGKNCCPYRSMVTPAMAEISVPDNLPISQRMLRQGVTSQTLTLRDILNRPEKSFYASDSSIAGQDETRTNTSFGGRRASQMSNSLSRGQTMMPGSLNRKRTGRVNAPFSRKASVASTVSYQQL